MKFRNRFILWVVIIVFSWASLSPEAAFSITIKEEEDLSRKIMQTIFQQSEIIDDPVIVDYVNKIGDKVASYFPEQLFKYHFYIIKTDGYNAFAIPGGHIFVYSGLLAAMQNEEELAGLLGHEIAHVYCRHISQKIERSKKIGIATLAGVAAGVLLGVTTGGEVGQAVTQGSMAAGQSAELAFTREDEIQADQLGLKYLDQAGYSGEGLLDILKKIRSQQWFGSDQIPTYLMTHPAVEDRIAYIDSWLETISRQSELKARVKSEEFERVHIRLVTRYGDEDSVLANCRAAVSEHPDDPIAHYQYGLILARVGRREDAIGQIKLALEKRAFDPYILSDLGRIYFLDGQYQKALNILENVHSMIPDDAECLLFLGRTQTELGQLKAASDNFYILIEKHSDYKQGYYFLGQNLGKQGNLVDAHYYLGLFYVKERDYKSAQAQLKRALNYTTDVERRQKIEKILEQLGPSKSKQGP